MDIKVELIGIPFPVCEDPTTGKVIVQVKMSGLVAPINTGALGPICASFKVEFKWLQNHEPHFYFHLHKPLEGGPANLAVNIFEGQYILRNSDFQRLRLQVGVSLRWYGNCYFCQKEFFGEEDVPKGWLPVQCTVCRKKLGYACAKCSEHRGGTEECEDTCPDCKSPPRESK